MELDIESITAINQHEEAHDFRESGGKVVQDISRFDQAGRARGNIHFGGKTITLTEDAWWGHPRSLVGDAAGALPR